MLKQYSEKRTESKKKAAEVLTEKWQREIAMDAKRTGHIALEHLVYILAADKQYMKILPELWMKYQCDLRGPKVPKVATARERIGLWFGLLERWGHGRVGGVPRKNDDSDALLKDISYLRLYRYNKVKGELELYNRLIDHSDLKVKLKDLKEYFMKTICIPLPSNLFSGQLGMSPTEKRTPMRSWDQVGGY